MNTYYRDAGPFDPAPSLTSPRAEQPIASVGSPGVWMITGYGLVRQILADPRFYPLAGEHLPHSPVGDLTGMDAPQHTERVTEITQEQQGPPADLDKIGALLGVPYEDCDRFQGSTRALPYATFVEIGTYLREHAGPTADLAHTLYNR